MQKIPTLFLRNQSNPKLVTRTIDSTCLWVLEGKGVASEKFDGTACAVIEGRLYRRHQHRQDRGDPPAGWIHWTKRDVERSGHGWLPVIEGDPASRHHLEAWGSGQGFLDGTYELVGKKIQGNPHDVIGHALWRHGCEIVTSVPLDFDGLREWLANSRPIEGLVWKDDMGRMAKIKRRDFGLPWPVKKKTPDAPPA